MFNHFRHRLLRTYVILLGTLFNNLYLTRYTQGGVQKETIKVPLSYGPKEKFLTRIKSDPSLTKSVSVTLPRMSFEIVGLTYDPERKQQTTLKLQGPKVSNTAVKSIYTAAPYDIQFSLNLYARNIEDGTQIAEQILPYFQPDFTVTATLIPSMELKKDIPIILNSVNQSIDYEGGFDSTRLITWQFDFTVKGYFFGPTANSSIIIGNVENSGNTGGAITNFYNELADRPLQTLYVNQISANNFTEGETVRSSTNYGTVLEWNRTAGKLILIYSKNHFDINDVLVGDYSHADATVTATDTSTLKIGILKTQQNPLSANVSSDFGYTEQLTEFPDTL